MSAPRPPADRAAELAANLAAVEQRLAAACAAAGRPRSAVSLVAVAKTFPAADIRGLAELGVSDVGESRDQEARGKVAELADLALRWHFVGQLQRNKCRSVARYADMVHSVDRPELVESLARAARTHRREVEVLVQVRLDAGQGRAGVSPEGLPVLADAVAGAAGLRLGGVMAVAPQGGDPAAAFDRLAALSAELCRSYPQARAVSAGMSGDLEAAVAAGATLVRVGTALFGRRAPAVH